MKNILILITALYFSSCAVVPKSTNKAKDKISTYKDRIDKIAAYHDLDSVWIEKKKVEFITPEVKNTIELETKTIDKPVIDSILVEYCKQKDSLSIPLREVLKEQLYKACEPDPIFYEDSLITLNIHFKTNGVIIDYKLKEQKLEKEVPCEQTIIEANIPWHQETPVRIGFILIGILVIITLTRKYL